MITFQTNLGDIKIELDFDKAPITAENFAQYAKDGFYNGTIFHRVIKGFMAQGGGFASGMEEKDTRDSIQNEANNGLENKRGTLAMARTQAQRHWEAQANALYAPTVPHARRGVLLLLPALQAATATH